MLFRLILALFLVSALALAFASVMLALNVSRSPQSSERTAMPSAFRFVAYAALLILMFGITTGLVGGA